VALVDKSKMEKHHFLILSDRIQFYYNGIPSIWISKKFENENQKEIEEKESFVESPEVEKGWETR